MSSRSSGNVIMLALNRKLARELWHLKSQLLSIALVVATGIMTVVTMRGSYEALVITQDRYYQQTRFADIWAPLRRAPETLLAQIVSLPGVAAADVRINFMATLDLEDLDAPATGRFMSLPETGRPLLNDIVVQRGRYIEPGETAAVLINEKFARARGLNPGDSIRAIINGRARELDIVGTAISPEHVYTMPPGSLMPDDTRFGILWMGQRALGAAFDMDGAFNEAFVRIEPGINPAQVIAGLNELLYPYGGFGAYPRRDQPSHSILQGELDQNRVMGTAIPAVFLGVAVFLLHLVLGRLISTQRGEIAVLKAFGYHNSEIAMHFLLFAIVAVLMGILVGVIGGVYLGQAYIGIYQTYFDLPGLDYRLQPGLLVLASAVSLLGACTGASSAVLKAVRLPPAEAMRPEPPANFRAGWLERTGINRLLPSSTRMILRNMERKPWQSLMSALGVAMSVAILVIGLFMFDSIRFLMDLQFRAIQREDVAISFYEHQADRVQHELWRLPGVTRVEPYRSIPVRLRHGHHHRDSVIQGLSADGELRRVIGASGIAQPIPAEGLLLSRLLAERLDVATGDTVTVEILEGRRQQREAMIAGVIDDYMGVSATMELTALQRLSGEGPFISGAYLSVSADDTSALYRDLKQMPAVSGVASPDEMLASFESEMAQGIFVSVGFLVGFAAVIAVGVIYNGARIALSERGRELASLRVMGFHRREVAILLLGEQALITLMAIPMGWLIGYGMAWLVVEGMQTDMFRIPYVINPWTWLFTALITVAAATASALAVRRRLDRFDLISVLKTRE
ncbi:ABC transporter permease [Pseudohongiella sp.]|nr:FtsX-like permease family protein [Pseudohongiella sp.]HDZ10198.1 FtsX-like permease family protein [Pseudohongiella sp.]HEA64270.1 FtsX-like permease family protein [Pseudohongiella sp.]